MNMNVKIEHKITKISRTFEEYSLYIFDIELHVEVKKDDKKIKYIAYKSVTLNVVGLLVDVSNEMEEIVENYNDYQAIEDVLEEIEDEYMDKVIEELAAKIPQLENCFQNMK